MLIATQPCLTIIEFTMVIPSPTLDSGALHQAAQSEPLLSLGFSTPGHLLFLSLPDSD